MERGAVHLHWINAKFAQLTLDNPQARNAVSTTMMKHLETHSAEICAQKASVVILIGAGEKAFCAGGDLKEVRSSLLNKRSALEMNQRMSLALSSFAEHNVFLIIALDGAAVGGGAELTAYGDYVIAHPESSIAFVHARLGVSPGWGGGIRLFQKIGVHKAKQVLIRAERMFAQEAYDLGLIDHIVSEGTAREHAYALAEKISQYPTDSLLGIRKICQNPTLDKEQEIFLSLWGEEAHRKALGVSASATS
jgi:enoyl-CoA hydratase